MSTFVKGVAQYFQNFLETDFRKRRLPKRNITSTNKDGNSILINLEKYRRFKSSLIKDLEKPNKYEFSFDIKPKAFTTSINSQSTDFIITKVIDGLDSKKPLILSSFKDLGIELRFKLCFFISFGAFMVVF